MVLLIKHESFTPEMQKQVSTIFGEHSIAETGIDGLEDPIVFEARENNEFAGCLVVQIFWGQLHIKKLVVVGKYRKLGIGRSLMEHALEFGKQKGCEFSFVETMNFQAPEFYQKLGFQVEFVRQGYDKETSFYYLRKDL